MTTRTTRPAASIRRAAWRMTIAAALIALAIGGAAASVRAAGPTLEIAKTSTPTSVTRGYNVLYTITVTNHSTAANHVKVSDPAAGQSLPAGTKFVSAKVASGPGTCPAVDPTTTSVTCDIGSLAAEQVVVLKIVLTIPASLTGDSFTNTASASLNEGTNDTQPQSSHTDLFPVTATTSVIAADDKNQASGYFETACNASNTADPSLLSTNQSLGTDNMQSTEACVPDFGGGTTMALAESAHGTGQPGFSETSSICVPAPGATCATPLTFSTPATFKFRLHPSQFSQFPKGWKYTELVVYDDGAPVTALCNTNGSIPTGFTVCKFPATQDNKTKIVTQVVKSLSNGSWNFG
jgi:uncharacterized repeat protein (TIGR01451 family)